MQSSWQTGLSILFQLACMHAKSLQSCVTWTVARQAPRSMRISRQEDWSGLPNPPPEDLPDPGNKTVGYLPLVPPRKPRVPIVASRQVMSDFLQPHSCSTPGFTVPYHLLEFAQTRVHSVMPSHHLGLCCPLLLPSIFLSIRVFSNKLELMSLFPFIHLLANVQWNAQHELAGLIRSRCSLYLLKYSLKYSLSTPYLHNLLINASFFFF